MAVDTAPKLTRRRNFAFAIEGTTGTAATLAAADGVTNVFSPTLVYENEEVDRDAQGTSISQISTAKGARSATATVETEIVGAGASGTPIWVRLLQGCGMTGSGGVYSFITPATETLTIGHYASGLLKKMVGAMGTATLTLKRGQKGRIAWNFKGVADQPSDTANIAPTYVSAAVAPRVGGTTFTVGGVTLRVPGVEIDLGNEITLREDDAALDSASEPTGYRAAMIVNRKPIIRMSPEALPLATKDWYDIYRDGTLLAFACNWGSASNNTFAIACPKLQLISNPIDEDRGGLLAHQLTFQAVRSAAVGDDEMTLTLT